MFKLCQILFDKLLSFTIVLYHLNEIMFNKNMYDLKKKKKELMVDCGGNKTTETLPALYGGSGRCVAYYTATYVPSLHNTNLRVLVAQYCWFCLSHHMKQKESDALNCSCLC